MAREILATRPVIYNKGGKLDGQWYVYYMFKSPHTGRMERFKESDGINIFKTVKDRTAAAQNVQAKLWRRLKGGYNPFDDPDRIYTGAQSKIIFNKHSIHELLLSSVKNITESSVKRTVTCYHGYINNFCNYLKLKGKLDFDISLISEDDATNFLNHLTDVKQQTAKTRNEHLSLLRRCFHYLKRRKNIVENPFEHCINKKQISNGRKFYRDGIRSLILDELELRPQLLLLIEMVYYTLARPKEIRFLQLKDIFLLDSRIEIPAEKSKNGKPRWITIPDPLLKKLTQLKLHEYPKDYYLFGCHGEPAAVPTGINYFRKKYKPIKAKFGFGREYGIYNWKHTGAIKADRANIPHKDIQNQGGWTSLAMLDVYMKDLDTIDSPQIRNNFPHIRSTTGSTSPV